jgi:signal transduction histidine kinase
MTITDLFASTAFRLATAFAGLFSLAVVSLLAILYIQVGRDLDATLTQRLMEDRDELVLLDRRDGFNELARVIANEADTVRNTDTLQLLVGPDGSFIAGNAKSVADFTGPAWLPRASVLPADPASAHQRYISLWTPVSGGKLLLGIGDGEVRKTQEILLRGFAWGLTSTVIAAFGLGALLGARTHRRIDRMARTLTAVANGKLSERVPLLGAGSDLDRVAGQLNAMLDQLQTLFESVHQSSSDIAHDLKAPIFRLRRRIETARRNTDAGEGWRTELDAAMDELDGITATFEALLDITQIESGTGKSRLRRIDLRDVVAPVLDAYEAVAEDAGRSLSMATGAEPLYINGDVHHLQRLLANLIENSIRHCPPGARIAVSLSRGDGTAKLRITDTGPGIPEGERANVFKRLYRLDKSRTTEGNGLGLALVKAICDLHGAAIALFDNAPGLGVDIAFPAA